MTNKKQENLQMNRSGKVYMKNVFCGEVSETDAGYLFEYNQEYLKNNLTESKDNVKVINALESIKHFLIEVRDNL